jgi:mRNA-degrading endonuclease RelE of RelBE toxin-antitoxin system
MFRIEITEEAGEDLRFLRKFEQRLILEAIELHLAVEPLFETRHRKPLRPNEMSSWELRIGAFRVFYDVEPADRLVRVKAVGWKEHNRLLIRGKEVPL